MKIYFKKSIAVIMTIVLVICTFAVGSITANAVNTASIKVKSQVIESEGNSVQFSLKFQGENVDEYGVPLGGAKFALYYDTSDVMNDTNRIAEATSDYITGKFTLKVPTDKITPEHYYFVRQIKCPKGYINDGVMGTAGQAPSVIGHVTLNIGFIVKNYLIKPIIICNQKETSLCVDNKISIKYSVANGDKKSTIFKSSNSKIATVNSSGVVTAKKAGTTTVTLSNNGATAKVKIIVKNPYLNITSKTIKAGKTFSLRVIGSVGKVTFTSSNKKVATVTSNGKITSIKAGKAIITAKTSKYALKCFVTVKK